VYDVSIRRAGGGGEGVMAVMLPAAVGRALAERGLNRARLEITDDGILVRPYRGEGKLAARSVVDLPESWA
jgi:hypothetical protein